MTKHEKWTREMERSKRERVFVSHPVNNTQFLVLEDGFIGHKITTPMNEEQTVVMPCLGHDVFVLTGDHRDAFLAARNAAEAREIYEGLKARHRSVWSCDDGPRPTKKQIEEAVLKALLLAAERGLALRTEMTKA